ncbi:MAG: hypothetical protein J0M07_18745 [Anaerolineae bacterium]|jgi:hypothetical protein|nr:hypothetical protein [Anaerolineae bacterium]
MDAAHSNIPHLKWVLVEGALCNVSDFSSLPPEERPVAYCPICERQVILKLGQKRIHHYAHRPEDTCPAANPETALHLNCKFHLYHQLLTARVLFVSSRCQRCSRTKPVPWKKDWDNVKVEYRLDSLRPDIALLKGEQVIGALEVFVTHAVNGEKIQKLRAQGVDWIEISAAETFYEEPDAWTPKRALDPIHIAPELPNWICSECQKTLEREQYQRDHPRRIVYAKMVDFYYSSGKKFRNVFYVKDELAYGERVRLWVEDANRRVIVEEKAPITSVSQKRLSAAFQSKLDEMIKTAAVVDQPMKWVRWESGHKFVARDLDNFPFRYAWNENRRKWVQQPGVKWKRL